METREGVGLAWDQPAREESPELALGFRCHFFFFFKVLFIYLLGS